MDGTRGTTPRSASRPSAVTAWQHDNESLNKSRPHQPARVHTRNICAYLR